MKDAIKKFLEKGTELGLGDLSLMVSTLSEIITDTEKAFGGCKICYGKGYATTIINQVQHADFEGDETVVTELDRIRPCSCDRGKQITILLNKHT